MNPVGWAIGLGIGALLAMLGPLVVALVLLRFLQRRVRTSVLILSATFGIASVVAAMFEDSSEPLPVIIGLVVFTMYFGYAAFAFSAVALFARFLLWLWRSAPVASLARRLRPNGRSNP